MPDPGPLESSPPQLRWEHDRQLRGPAAFSTEAGGRFESLGVVLRYIGPGHSMVMLKPGVLLSPAEVEAEIAGQVRHFRKAGVPFEWKTYRHDQPIGPQLEAAGLMRGPAETVMVAEAVRVPRPEPPDGVEIRAARSQDDFLRVAAQFGSTFGYGSGDSLRAVQSAWLAHPDRVVVLLAETGGEVVASARMELPQGSDFATLWGGSTSPPWRGRGLYRCLIHRRARMALDEGRRLLCVEALPTSQRILDQLGFVTVTETTPYLWAPG